MNRAVRRGEHRRLIASGGHHITGLRKRIARAPQASGVRGLTAMFERLAAHAARVESRNVSESKSMRQPEDQPSNMASIAMQCALGCRQLQRSH
jgi:hypothetical protein